jgi:hypothetical protein
MAVGFIGLGVMGEPICRNIMRGSGEPFVVFDLDPAPVERLAAEGARAAASVAEVAQGCDLIFLSLPGGPELESVAAGAEGLLAHAREGQVVVDTTTAPVGLTRDLAHRFAERGVRMADAPVARTRAAAVEGTLSIMVGADPDLFARLEPMLRHAASEVTHCGGVGCGQVVKLMNNMVLFETVAALSEALALGEGAGVDRRVLFETLAKGSADSFALRNHGLKAMIPDEFPEGAFPTDYALKDVSYALQLAQDLGLEAPGAELARERMEAARAAGFGKAYFPVMARLAGRPR